MRAAREEGVDRPAAAAEEAMAEGILDLLLAAYRSIEIGEGPIINITVMATVMARGVAAGPGSMPSDQPAMPPATRPSESTFEPNQA